MTTYTALRYQDNLYLVREPVLEEPKIPITMDEREERGLLGKYDKDLAAYHAQFTSAILVPKEHEHLFEGRTGMVEGKDFERRGYCEACSSIGCLNCAHFDECGNTITLALPIQQEGEALVSELIGLRNKLYNALPTGEIDAWELLQTIKWHCNDLDTLINKIHSQSKD